MKYFLSLLAAMIVACSLLGCHKKNADNTDTNALVLKSAGQTEDLFYSIGSAFRGGSDLDEWAVS